MISAITSTGRLRIALIALILALLALAPQAQAGKLLDIRVGDHGDSVRVVLDLDGEISVTFGAIDGTDDWVAIIPNFCPMRDPPRLKNPHSFLKSIEAECDGSILRVSLYTTRLTKPRTFLLPGGEGKPWRFVIDLGPDERRPPEPLPVEPEPLPRREGPWRIMIDPGHGGKDPGASANGIVEKRLVLDVSKRIADILNKRPGFEARLTRETDKFLNLRRRMRTAEDYEADAFMSIHANAVRRGRARGVEVFFLSIGGATSEAARELARLENEADPDYVVEEDSLLKDLPFGVDLRQTDTIMRSSRLSEAILTALERSKLAASRGVKQAGFAVLKSYQVPSTLVEIGFMSNATEAKNLKSRNHRDKLARTIAAGAIEYFESSARAHVEEEKRAP